MTILSRATGYDGFKVIDDATNTPVENVTWVDDVALEYEIFRKQAHYSLVTSIWGMEIVKVSAVTVNHAAREIHVNQPQPVVLSITLGKTPREPSACDECCEEGSCKRIGQCLRFKCEFGSVDKP
jgi:hypothetical protein